jgi:Ca-activated chloride channel family protein
MNFSNPHFAEPVWLWLAVGSLALLGWLLIRARQARQKQLAAFATPQVLEQLLASHSPGRRLLKNAMSLLAVAGLSVAMARPQWGEQAQVTKALGEDVLFLLDCSKSMLATDIRPDRLERARLAVLDFVQRHGRGRVGLVAFAGQAFLQCPLTFDYDAFREALDAVNEDTIPVQGTDIARALQEASLAMEKDQRRKFMVLLTDGEDLEKGGITRAKQLAEQGVRVYSIGVGTAAGGPIQVPDGRGGWSPLRDDKGEIVESRLDETTLRQIAEVTGGEYQPLGAIGEGMTAVRKALASASDKPGASTARKFGIDRFHGFIALGLLLLVVESLIGTRRKAVETQANA